MECEGIWPSALPDPEQGTGLVVIHDNGVSKLSEKRVGGKGVREKLMKRAAAKDMARERGIREADLRGKGSARLAL